MPLLRRPAAALRRPAGWRAAAGDDGVAAEHREAALHRPAAAAAEAGDAEGQPTGPLEAGSSTRAGRGRRQYCWWITFPFPYPETVARLNLKTPAEYEHASFLAEVLAVHQAAQIAPVEIAIFKETHLRTGANGERLPHFNALCRYGDMQCTWTVLGEKFKEARLRVDFADHIRTWYDGIVYGRVSSSHKPQEELDPSPTQWAANGVPLPFNEVLPAKWHKHGRQPNLSALQAYDLLARNNVRDEMGAWALAKKLEGDGQRGLIAFLLERNACVRREGGNGADQRGGSPAARAWACWFAGGCGGQPLV